MGSYPISPHHTMSAGQSLYSYQDHLSWNLLFFFPFPSYSSFRSLFSCHFLLEVLPDCHAGTTLAGPALSILPYRCSYPKER